MGDGVGQALIQIQRRSEVKVQLKSDGHNGETLDGPLVYGNSPSEDAMLDLNILHSTLEKHPSLTGLMQVSIVQPGKLKPAANWQSVRQLR